MGGAHAPFQTGNMESAITPGQKHQEQVGLNKALKKKK